MHRGCLIAAVQGQKRLQRPGTLLGPLRSDARLHIERPLLQLRQLTFWLRELENGIQLLGVHISGVGRQLCLADQPAVREGMGRGLVHLRQEHLHRSVPLGPDSETSIETAQWRTPRKALCGMGHGPAVSRDAAVVLGGTGAANM
eukprot:Skav209883  [mRNA]  locus=scaffold2642:63203:65890:- [translate_table: standard]